jgi:hypothetical protein
MWGPHLLSGFLGSRPTVTVEPSVKIPVVHGHLEAVLRDPVTALRGGGIFCHPHPLHGGTMHTKAVYRASQALSEAGLRVLRFNFRGVGCSTGSFDEGVGEAEDARAALDWLGLGLPAAPLVAGGVSFGSHIALTVGTEDPRVVAMVALGTPVHVYDYSFLARSPKPVLVVQGEHDRFGTPEEVRAVMRAAGGQVTVKGIRGAGHLFDGRFQELQDAIHDYFTAGPGEAALALRAGDPGTEPGA